MASSKKAQANTFHDGKRLTMHEEAVVRLQQGIESEDDEVLERKTNNPELLARLLELERAIFSKAAARKKG